MKDTALFEDYYDITRQTKTDSEAFSVPLGITESNILKTLSFSHMPHQNVLVTGYAGTGKSTFLHAVLNTILLHQSADQAQIWIYDGTEYEFQTCKSNHPPHIAYVGGGDQDSSFEAFLQSLEEEYRKRTQYVIKSGQPMFVDCLQKYGSACIPRAFVLIDCFDHFLKKGNEKNDWRCRINKLLRMGFVLGVTFFVTAQDCAPYRWMDRPIERHFGIRVCLSQSDESIREQFQIPDAIRLETSLKTGEALIEDITIHKVKLLWISPQTEKQIIHLSDQRG